MQILIKIFFLGNECTVETGIRYILSITVSGVRGKIEEITEKGSLCEKEDKWE